MKVEKKLQNWRISILKSIKTQIRELLGARPYYLEKYYQNYRKIFKNRYKRVREEELFKKIENSKLIFIGDYHTLKEAQNFQLKVLKFLKNKEKKLILYLEPYSIQDQRFIEEFFEGKINEDFFLQKIKFKKKWGFEWENYREILNFAKENKIKTYGINLSREASLRERDLYAAKFILKKFEENPEYTHLVIIGDLHLAPEHLPLKILKNLKISTPHLIIYQNSETIYLKEMEKGKELDLKVVKINSNSYCVFNVEPWVKYQSFLIYLMRSKTMDVEEKNLDDLAVVLMEKLGSFFNKKWECNLEVKTFEEYDFLVNLLNVERSYPFFFLLQESYSFFLPYENIIWIPYPDLLRFVEELAHFIFYEEGKWKGDHIFKEDYFWERIIYYAFGYFSSKLLFEDRKTQSIKELKKILRERSDERAENKLQRLKKAIPYIIKINRNFNKKSVGEFEKLLDEKLCFSITRRTGYLLGEKWFLDFKKGKINLRDIICRIPKYKER